MPSEQVTDEELMERVKAGDEQAFTLLIARYERPLLTFLSRFIGDSHLARDLYQEVFLRVYLKAKEYTPVRKFSAWLYRIAINLCIDELRRRKSAAAFDWDSLLRGHPPDAPEAMRETGDPFWQVERRELQTKIQQAVSGLPSDHRLIFLLKYYQGFSYEEIGELLQCPVGTVKSRVHTALVRLKSALSGYRVPEHGR